MDHLCSKKTILSKHKYIQPFPVKLHKNANYSNTFRAVADPDQAFGGQSNWGAPRSLQLLKYQSLSATIVSCNTKMVTFCRPKSGYFCWSNYAIFQGKTSLKALYIINSEKVWNGSQTVGLVFHKLHRSRISTKFKGYKSMLRTSVCHCFGYAQRNQWRTVSETYFQPG